MSDAQESDETLAEAAESKGPDENQTEQAEAPAGTMDPQTVPVEPPADPEERFQNFLRKFQSKNGDFKYRTILAQFGLGSEVKVRLVVDFEDLMGADKQLVELLINAPDEYLPYFSNAAMSQLRVEDPSFAEICKKIAVRFRGLPESKPFRKIGEADARRLVLVNGIIVKASQIKPLLMKAAFQCKKCKSTTFVDQKGRTMTGPGICGRCRSKVMEFSEEQSVFVNCQDLLIQERPEDLPPGQLPRAMEVKVTEDMVDVARPGDRVALTGIIRMEQGMIGASAKLREWTLYIEANFMDVIGKEVELIEITPEEEAQIIELSKDPWINRKLVSSLAPSIYGYHDIKEAILYLLFGAVPKVLPDGVVVRGDVNVLLIGDPGTAKSQLLQYVARVAPRGLYTSGRGTTAAGLTAAVVREKTGGFALEAGALVLADKGVCCIDEIDKMRPDDRVAIHEAMEQHTVSIAKGGIVARLNARASVLAAANPALGRYDTYRNITDNISLPITILSRFDLIFVMKDIPALESDTKLSEHIIALHRSKATAEEASISPELFRKYISYAHKILPELTDEVSKEIIEYYLKTRATSATAEAAIAITPRQLEALIRLSECRARAFLRKEVTVEDGRAAIRLMTIALQDVGIDMATGKVDIDVIMTGKPKSLRDKMQTVLSTLAEMEKATGTVEEKALCDELSKRAGLPEGEARAMIEQLKKDNIVYSPKHGHIKHIQ